VTASTPRCAASPTPERPGHQADIAAYYAQLGSRRRQAAPEAQPRAQPASRRLLQKAACVSCHGANFSKPIDPSYPKIAGQHSDYLFVALQGVQDRQQPAVGRNNGVMGAIAKQFSNAELKALAGTSAR
jgi:cytochrome c553